MKIWLHIAGQQIGPLTSEQISKMNITPLTPVWYEGLPNWMPAGEVPVTAKILADQEAAKAQVHVEEPAQPVVEVVESTVVEASETADAPEATETVEQNESESTVVEAQAETVVTPEPVNPYFESAPWMQQSMPQGAPWAQPQQPQEKKPANLLWLSILLTVLCCNPFSIAAIISGAVVNKRNVNGDIEGARRANEVTQWLIAISIVLFIIFLPVLMCAM